MRVVFASSFRAPLSVPYVYSSCTYQDELRSAPSNHVKYAPLGMACGSVRLAPSLTLVHWTRRRASGRCSVVGRLGGLEPSRWIMCGVVAFQVPSAARARRPPVRSKALNIPGKSFQLDPAYALVATGTSWEVTRLPTPWWHVLRGPGGRRTAQPQWHAPSACPAAPLQSAQPIADAQ